MTPNHVPCHTIFPSTTASNKVGPRTIDPVRRTSYFSCSTFGTATSCDFCGPSRNLWPHPLSTQTWLQTSIRYLLPLANTGSSCHSSHPQLLRDDHRRICRRPLPLHLFTVRRCLAEINQAYQSDTHDHSPLQSYIWRLRKSKKRWYVKIQYLGNNTPY